MHRLLLALATTLTIGSAAAQTTEHRVGPYEFRIVTQPSAEQDDVDIDRLEVRRDGRIVLEQAGEPGERYSFSESVPAGTDVTGRGVPDVVVEHYSGGAHCCVTALVFEAGDKLSVVAEIDGGQTDTVSFEERGGIGWTAIVADWTFAYWNTSFAESPACSVPLAYRDGAFQPVLELMRLPPYGEALLAQLVEEQRAAYRDAPNEFPPPSLWSVMMALIYTGNPDQADAFLDRAWPEADRGKAAFRRDFRKQLAQSPFWPALQALGRMPAPPGVVDAQRDPPC